MADDPKDFGLITGPIRPRPPEWLPDEIWRGDINGRMTLGASFRFRIGTQEFHTQPEVILQPGDSALEVFRLMLDNIWQQAEGTRLRAQGIA